MHPTTPSPVRATARRWRRLLRFSLGAFLAGVTIVCIALAVLTQRAREQRAAVSRIRELGGVVSYDYEYENGRRKRTNAQPPGWPWLRRLVGDEYFQDVVLVRLDETRVTDDDLRLIGKLRGVKTLGLNWTSISDEGLAEIAGLKRLQSLGLHETRITSRGLSHLEGMKDLHDLQIGGTQVDDEGMETIGSLENLSLLGLPGRLTPRGIRHLARLPKLRFLSIAPADDSVLPDLIALQKLDTMALNSTRLSGGGLLTLRDGLPECEFWDGDTVDLSSIRGEFTAGRWQQIVHTLQRLNGERRLKLVDLSGTLITDSQLGDLHELDYVQMFDLRDTPQLTDDAVASLRLALPHCAVRR